MPNRPQALRQAAFVMIAAALLATLLIPNFLWRITRVEAAAGAVNITTLGSPISQNFDTLVNSGTVIWSNNSTIAGWYHARTGTGTNLVANNGGSNAGNLYSYGTGTNTDRALGSIGSGNAAAGNFYWGVRLANESGGTITSLTISYTGEQWRNGGGAAAAQTADFSYRLGLGLGNTLTDFTTGGTAVPQLSFTSPVPSGTAAALDGNAAGNRTAISHTITGLSIAPGEEILLRWSDIDHPSNDHGLSIDDFSITANGVVDPSPTPTPTPNVIINEVDSDTPGTDAAEFVELYDGGVGNTSLAGLVVVFYTGSSDQSYAAFDLDAFSTDANGYFVLGNAGVTGVDLTFGNNLLQNGEDAVALYAANASDFPDGTLVTTANLVDALVYDTSDPNDPGLLILLNAGQPQVNEDAEGDGATNSNQRCPNGTGGARNTSTYSQAAPTADGINVCTPPPPSPTPTPAGETGPSVTFTSPGTNGINAPRDASMTVGFSEPVDVAMPWYSINCATTGLHNSATIAGGPSTYVITPNVNFLAGENCTVTIFKDQVQDQDGDDSAPNTNTMAADHTWSFTVSTGTAPPYPPSVHLTMGNPSGATADTNQPTNYLMEKPEFTLSYHRDRGGPNWVSWHLSAEWFGTLPRRDTFRPDPQVPPEWYRVQATDFSGSGFDRGHNVPNADRDKETSIPINQATFLMSNMIPQAPNQNQGPWADMENDLRTIVSAGNEMYIIMGGHGTGGTGSNGFAATIANGKVTVPNVTWRVMLVLPIGVDDISRASCDSRTIAVIMPNVNIFNGSTIRDDDWQDFIVSVDAVETLTGYDFFSNLPDPVERCLEAGINGVNPPLDSDEDGVPDSTDNCPFAANPSQADFDNDGVGDACDTDDDGDGVADGSDLCPNTAPNTQVNAAGCPDADGDGVADTSDNCPFTSNPDQTDTDSDGVGNSCDFDDDGDGVLDAIDNCPLVPNPDQADFDLDGAGDVCDPVTGPPTNKDQCKNDGWQRFDFPRFFKNQGDCIQFVNTGH